jgi:hypothetical protein
MALREVDVVVAPLAVGVLIMPLPLESIPMYTTPARSAGTSSAAPTRNKEVIILALERGTCYPD